VPRPVMALGAYCARSAAGSASGCRRGSSLYSWFAPPSAQMRRRAAKQGDAHA